MRRLSVALLSAAALAGCRQDMHDQPRYEAYEASDFFSDGRASRAPVAGTVARGHLREDAYLETGKSGDTFGAEFPFSVGIKDLERGQQRYEIFCTPCHDRAGLGGGMVVMRGYRRPPSLHIDRLREAPAGYLFDVITSGFGAMPDYAMQIPARDRWAIVAYIRALQLSQNASLTDVPIPRRGELGPKEP
jgi:hypothetical protein